MESKQMQSFFNLYRQGFVRVAAAAPRLRPAEPMFNTERTIEMLRIADAKQSAVVLFPELGISGYSIDDLLQQEALLEAVEAGLSRLVAVSRDLFPLFIVGAPIMTDGRLYNAAVIIHRGRVLAIVPKTFLPNYREFYERRHFASGAGIRGRTVRILGQIVPFGTDILVQATDMPDFVLHAEICEDVWTPIPPSSFAAMAGATVLTNLSASNATVGKADYRHALCRAHSGRCLVAYLFSAAGPGESTTDLAWDGQAVIYEMGTNLAEAPRFPKEPQIIFADVDIERIQQERLRQNTFSDCAEMHIDRGSFRTVGFELGAPIDRRLDLERSVSRFPYVSDDDARLNELCFEAYNIQSHGLRKRLESTGIKRIVIGVSGGLDSTHALLVAAHTFDALGLPRQNILAFALPAFATSERTRRNAFRLMEALGVSVKEIDMIPQCRQMLADIGHSFAAGNELYDVTFENVQAGARTATLFRLANQHNALVLGTGDLSELALGWCTYGVGDHMSHYNVNASVPKTLIQHLIRWVMAEGVFGPEVAETLTEILNTEISPELVPGDESGEGPSQRTEEIVGPYELQDFNLFYITRYGLRPSKVAFLAAHAWGDKTRGSWPRNIPPEGRHEYTLAQVKDWLGVFLKRFFQTSQFKRSALPNGPKVSSGGSLSPRGDWRAPSDTGAAVWLDELSANVPDLVGPHRPSLAPARVSTTDQTAKNVPVVFILYNRPELTALTWKAIEHWQPAQLFLIADGPKARDQRDLELCQDARQIVEEVNWRCDVRRLYSQTNLGCRQRVSSGLDQVFAEVESAIILEDDCLVQDDFFSFCATLLKRYADDTRFWGVSGTSYLNFPSSEQETYFATRYASSWGWATWRRAWQKVDLQMRFWPQWRKNEAWHQSVDNAKERWYWNLLFDDCYKKRIDSWATPFLANQWHNNGLFLMSSHNLVSNVGFGKHGTHTRDSKSPMAARDIEPLSKGVRSGQLTPDPDRETKIFDIAFNGNKMRFPVALYTIPRLVLGRYYRWLRALK